jgi:hypothetical protein
LLSVDGQKSQRASRSGMGAFSMSRRSLCVFVSSPTRPVSLRMRALSRSGVPLFDRPKRGRKKPHRERPGTDYRPRRLIEWSSTITRAPSPFSRGRRTGRGDGMGPFTRVLDIVQHSISPLQGRDLEAGVLLCAGRRFPEPRRRTVKGLGQTIGPGARSIGPPRTPGPRVPSPEGEGQEEGTGWPSSPGAISFLPLFFSPF